MTEFVFGPYGKASCPKCRGDIQGFGDVINVGYSGINILMMSVFCPPCKTHICVFGNDDAGFLSFEFKPTIKVPMIEDVIMTR